MLDFLKRGAVVYFAYAATAVVGVFVLAVLDTYWHEITDTLSSLLGGLWSIIKLAIAIAAGLALFAGVAILIAKLHRP